MKYIRKLRQRSKEKRKRNVRERTLLLKTLLKDAIPPLKNWEGCSWSDGHFF